MDSRNKKRKSKLNIMKIYILQNKETGTFIEEFITIEDAKINLKAFEICDVAQGIYTPEFYEIVEKEIN
jgi:hypothetical protein